MTRPSSIVIVALIAMTSSLPTSAQDRVPLPAPSSFDPNKVLAKDLTPEQIAKLQNLGYKVIRQNEVFLIIVPPFSEPEFALPPVPTQPVYTLA